MNSLTPKPASSVSNLLSKAKAVAKAQAPRGRIVFALDATGSREPTWNMAKRLQSDMLAAAARIGTLDVALAYFRGHNDTQFAPFTSDANELISLMNEITCEYGTTQIGTILHHSLQLHTAGPPLNAIVFVGDTYEDTDGSPEFYATQLGASGVPIFIFHEGDTKAHKLRNLATLSSGAYASFTEGSASELSDLLQSIAAFATGGIKALEAKAGTSSAARLLLTQLK